MFFFFKYKHFSNSVLGNFFRLDNCRWDIDYYFAHRPTLSHNVLYMVINTNRNTFFNERKFCSVMYWYLSWHLSCSYTEYLYRTELIKVPKVFQVQSIFGTYKDKYGWYFQELLVLSSTFGTSTLWILKVLLVLLLVRICWYLKVLLVLPSIFGTYALPSYRNMQHS